MPFATSEEEQLIQKTMREFAKSITLEAAADNDRHDRFPEAHVAAAAGLGLTAIADPSSGLGPTAYILALDEVAQVDPNTAAALLAHNACLAALQGTDLAATLGPRLAGGELAAWCVSEEANGSNADAPGTVAKPAEGGYVLTGQKVWSINAAAAKHLLVLATIPGKGEDTGPTLFAVPADAQGVSRGQNEPLMGLRAAGIRTIYLYAVQVPASAVVGAPGKGLEALARGNLWLQLGAAASLNGCVAGGLEAAARFSENRVQFGAPIGTYQAVSDGLTNIDLQLAASRALALQAAGRASEPDAFVWAARAKAFAAEMAIPMTRQAIRVQGGTGFMREGGTERFARDARALQFVGATNQMMRDTIKRAILPGITFPATP